MDKAMFRRLIKTAPKAMQRQKQGKANWKGIIARAKKDKGVYTTTQFCKKFIKGVINRGRVKQKLHKLTEEDKICARLYMSVSGHKTYVWTFSPALVKAYQQSIKQVVSQ